MDSTTLFRRAQRLWDAGLDLLLGASCHGCTAPGRSPCAACVTQMVPNPAIVSQSLVAGVPVYSAFAYAAPTSLFIIAYKDREAWHLTRSLGEALVAALGRPPPGAVIVPVPSSPVAVRTRGFDHTLTLARWAAKRTQTRAAPLLRYVRSIEHVGMGATQRRVLTRDSMRAKPGRSVVVLIDDVTTTGASLAEAHRALTTAGHEVAYAATIAHVLAPVNSSGSNRFSPVLSDRYPPGRVTLEYGSERYRQALHHQRGTQGSGHQAD